MLLWVGYHVNSIKLSYLWSHPVLPVCCSDALLLYVIAVSPVVDKLLLSFLFCAVHNVECQWLVCRFCWGTRFRLVNAWFINCWWGWLWEQFGSYNHWRVKFFQVKDCHWQFCEQFTRCIRWRIELLWFKDFSRCLWEWFDCWAHHTGWWLHVNCGAFSYQTPRDSTVDKTKLYLNMLVQQSGILVKKYL